MRTKSNIARHELIGLEIRVIKANADISGLEGRVVDETKNMLVIETPKGEKRIPKKYSVFEFRIPGGPVRVDGNRLLFRPEDRTKRAR